MLGQKVKEYVKGLNSIYQNTILKYPPYEDIYFEVGEVRKLQNFMVGCENKVHQEQEQEQELNHEHKVELGELPQVNNAVFIPVSS